VLEQALAREVRISTALKEVGSALGATLDLDDLLELILGKLTELIEADRATLYLLDEQRKELVSRLVVGEQVRSIRIRVGHGIAGVVAQTGRPIRISDAYSDARFERDWDVLTGYRTTSMLAAPLKNHLGRTIGVIQVLNKQHGGVFTDEDEAILAALSTQAAVAIDNSRLFLSLIQKNKQLLDTKEQLELKVRDLELLFELERSTARATSLEMLATAVLSKLAAACQAQGASLLLAEDETGDLVQYTLAQSDPENLRRLGVKAGEGFLASVFLNHEALNVLEGKHDSRWREHVEGTFPFEVSSVLCAPLDGDHKPLGAIGLFTRSGPQPFSEEDAELLRLVGANVSTAVRLFNASRSRENSERLTSIGRLLSQVIHDFKTPMTVISGYVQLMQDCDDADKRSEYTEQILRQFDSLTSMQREVLEFARGERTVFVRRVYLKKFFAEITRQLEQEVQGRPVELQVRADPKIVARFDEGRVERAIFNLSRNAIEAMQARGGTLTVTAGMDGHDLVIAVSDTGPGIPPEIEGRLFQSFVTAGKQGGTGLGLAIVKKIVEEHGGTISVSSTKDAAQPGARFEMRFPQPEPKDGRSVQRSSEVTTLQEPASPPSKT
jgi:signal transduction histidine kinase/putative methionine-R-sulfoxide reductase with GAF domain